MLKKAQKQGVNNTYDFRNNTMGLKKKKAELLFLKNRNDTEVMQTKV